MPVSEEYLTYVIDQLECIGPVQSRRMFGGAGLYFDGLFFALIADDVLYFKVDDSNRSDYEAAGMGPFSSAILDMYFTMNDRQAHAAMNSMRFEAEKTDSRKVSGQSGAHFKQALPQPTAL